MLSGVGMIWPAMMITSTAFQAVASVLKVRLNHLVAKIPPDMYFYFLKFLDVYRNLFSLMLRPVSRCQN